MNKNVLISSLAAMLLLLLAYGFNGHWPELLIILLLGLLWLFGQWRGWVWTASLGLAGFVGTAALATLYGLSAAWSLPGIIAALIAWDLDRFIHSLHNAPRVEGEDDLWRAHVRRLFIVVGMGALPAVVALLLQVEFSFGWTLLLALLAIAGLSRAVGALRRGSE